MPETLSPEERARTLWIEVVDIVFKTSVAYDDRRAMGVAAITEALQRQQADEREECAGILEAFAVGAWEKVKDKPLEESLGVRPAINAALDIAAAIRARSTTSEEGGRNG
ncbi:hypothetical protein [Azospirillum sp.]|uniref:hypothetical protein n=1 Tax=Azospirillum sp. TaxID=34012 RepID=UPI003D724149